MKKNIIILLLSICSCLYATDNILVLKIKDGSQQLYDIHESIEIRTSDDSLYIISHHLNVSYCRKKVKGYSFTKDGSIRVGIDSPTISADSQITFYREGKNIIIRGVSESQGVKIHSINGSVHHPHIIKSTDGISINFSSMHPGIYIITFIDSHEIPSIKFINQ